jgi:hypothetical protein
MAQGFSAETVGVLDGTLLPAAKSDGRVTGAKLRAFQATFDLSLAAVKKAAGDTNVCFRVPPSCKPLFGYLNSSATMGAASTIAVGTAAAPGKYRAAAIHTTANAPQFFMLSAAGDDAPLSAEEDIIFTIAVADLPAAGILQIVMFCSAR